MARQKLDISGKLLRQEIRIEQPTVTIDANGAQILTWALYYECRAEARPLSAYERFQNQMVTSSVNYHFRIRYCKQASAVTSKMRIVMGSQTFDIDGPLINVDHKNHWLIIRGVEKNV